MKEPGMAGSEAADEFVHAALEPLRVFNREDLLPAVPRELRPPGAIEIWLEVFLRHLRDGLIENLRPLIEGQHCWSRF